MEIEKIKLVFNSLYAVQKTLEREKGKEVGDVGKIKSDVSISDEDLKYLRDIAETNYIIRLQQISPHATVNYSSSGGDSEQDAKKLLDMMEDMIVEQVATNLL